MKSAHPKQVSNNAAASVPVNSAAAQVLPLEIESSIKEFKNIITNASENGGRLAAAFSSLIDNVLEGKLNSSSFVTILLSPNQDTSTVKIPLILAHSTALDIANTIWLLGCQVNMKENPARWKKLCELVKAFSTAEIFIRCPSIVSITGVPIVASSVLQSRNVPSVEGSVTLSMSMLFTTILEFPLLIGAEVLKLPRTNPSNIEEIESQSDILRKRMMKINTAMVYKQQKYNLLREETEGYSKLLVVLSMMPHSESFLELPNDVLHYIKNILSLIGYFDLDPNRVLDIVLDAFEQQPANLSFVALLKHFPVRNIVHVLGFKFLYYQQPSPQSTASADPSSTTATTTTVQAATTKAVSATTTDKKAPQSLSVAANKVPPKGPPTEVPANTTTEATASVYVAVAPPTPASLYMLSAVLILSEVVALDDLLLYLQPLSEDILADIQRRELALRKDILSYGVVSLNASANTSASLPTLVEGLASAPLSMEIGSSGDKKPPPPPPLPLPANGQSLAGASAKPPPPAYPPPSGVSAPIPKPSSSVSLSGDSSGKQTVDTKDAKEPSSQAGTTATSTLDLEELILSSRSESEVNYWKYSESEHSNYDHSYAKANQLIGLVCGLLKFRGWKYARYILNILESKGVNMLMLLSSYRDLRTAIIELVDWQIQILYQPISFSRYSLSRNSRQVADKDKEVVLSASQNSQLTNLSTFPQDISPILSYIGYHICEDPYVSTKICKVLKAHIEAPQGDKISTTNASSDVVEDSAPSSASAIIAIFANALLPGLSIKRGTNTHLAFQIHSTLSLLPFSLRFCAYDIWRGSKLAKDGVGTKPSELSMAETKVLHIARSELKRLAKENTKVVGRKLTKCTTPCPIVVYNYILGQIENFDNMIPFAVEALKYSNDLSRDVMTYCLVAQLKGKREEKLKEGDTHYSQWFSSLSKFIAMFYGRYHSTELRGLLHYLLRSFGEGQSLDLLVLKDLLAVMGGCDTLLEVSQIQLEGLSAGKALRAEVMMTSNNSSAKQLSVNKKAAAELRAVLMSSRTAIPLLLFIAQIRTNILGNGDSLPNKSSQLKLLAHLFDISQEVLMQFTEFLVTAGLSNSSGDLSAVANNKLLEKIVSLMPSLPTMIDEVGLAVPVAFQLVRPIMREVLRMGFDPQSKAIPEYLREWHPLGVPMDSFLSGTGVGNGQLPENLWNLVSPKMFMQFWCLSLYDINVPTDRYDMEVKRLKMKVPELEAKVALLASGGGQVIDAQGLAQTMSKADVEKLIKQRRAEINKTMATMTELSNERAYQESHVKGLRDIMVQEADIYFLEAQEQKASMNAVMQYLVHPRLLMSPVDAVYCTKFFLNLHKIDTPRFSYLKFCDNFFSVMPPLLYSTTEREASFLGYAFNDLLSTINDWRTNKAKFIEEFQKHRGCGDVSMEKFQSLHAGWHSRLTNVLLHSLSSTEYMYIRSALIFLSKVSMQFPSRGVEGRCLLQKVDQLRVQEKKNEREDLHLMALSLVTILKRNSASWQNPSDGTAIKVGSDEKDAKDKDKDKDRREKEKMSKDKERDKDKDKEREKDRDRESKDKEKEKNRGDRERDREIKDKDKDRDRSDRDREREKEKEATETARNERIAARESKDRDREKVKEEKDRGKDSSATATTSNSAAAQSVAITSSGQKEQKKLSEKDRDRPERSEADKEKDKGGQTAASTPAFYTAAAKRKLAESGTESGNAKSMRRAESGENLKQRLIAAGGLSSNTTTTVGVDQSSSSVSAARQVNTKAEAETPAASGDGSSATGDVESAKRDKVDRDHKRDKDHKKEKDKEKDSKEKSRGKEKEKEKEKEKDREKDREKDKESRGKEKAKDKERDRLSSGKHKAGETEPPAATTGTEPAAAATDGGTNGNNSSSSNGAKEMKLESASGDKDPDAGRSIKKPRRDLPPTAARSGPPPQGAVNPAASNESIHGSSSGNLRSLAQQQGQSRPGKLSSEEYAQHHSSMAQQQQPGFGGPANSLFRSGFSQQQGHYAQSSQGQGRERSYSSGGGGYHEGHHHPSGQQYHHHSQPTLFRNSQQGQQGPNHNSYGGSRKQR